MGTYKKHPDQSVVIIPGLGRVRPGQTLSGDLDRYVDAGLLVKAADSDEAAPERPAPPKPEPKAEPKAESVSEPEPAEDEAEAEEDEVEGSEETLTHEDVTAYSKDELLSTAEANGLEVPSKLKRARVSGLRAFVRKELLGQALTKEEVESYDKDDLKAAIVGADIDIPTMAKRSMKALREHLLEQLG